MKTLRILVLVFVVSSLSNNTFAATFTIRRVNNNFGVTGVNVYASVQAAHDASNPNDIIIIEPSSTTYGDLTLTKPLKIYGNGYFLSTNTELKADQRNSTLAQVIFDSGSDGAEMYGIYATSYIYLRGVSNIKLSRNNCYIIYIYNTNLANTPANVSNINIENNYINNYIYQSYYGGFTISNVIVKNNILSSLNGNADPAIQSWVVTNNTFTGGNNCISIVNSVIENNLFTGYQPTITTFNTTASYNVSNYTTFGGSGIGNQDSYNVAAEFIPGGVGISTDEGYQLNAGSPLKTAGNGGIEVGAYGGGTPYVVSGIPAIPAVLKMINSATGDGSHPLDVTISVKSNN
jgi:hypothetical protein